MKKTTKDWFKIYITNVLKFLPFLPLGITSNATEAILSRYLLSISANSRESLEQKIAKLSESLHESSKLMAEIDIDLKEQEAKVERLKKEAKQAKLIKEQNKDEVDAFVDLLDFRMKHAGIITIIWGAIFCIIGIIGGFFISKIFRSPL